jgi:hypothetical protein
MLARSYWIEILLGVIAFAVVCNVVFMDYMLITGQVPWMRKVTTTVTPTPAPKQVETNGAACSPSCITAIENATASMQLAAPSSSSTQSTTSEQKAVYPKDYFIPLGSGYTTDNKWVNVGGTDTTINTADYGKIKQVIFQASMHIPVANGTMYARLYNVTDDHPVWNSDVSTGEGTSTMMSSQKITLDPGSKLYRVQISTSLQYPSYLDFARIKITIQ